MCVVNALDSYSAKGAAAFVSAALDLGMTIVQSVEVYENPTEEQAATAVEALKTAKCRAMFMMVREPNPKPLSPHANSLASLARSQMQAGPAGVMTRHFAKAGLMGPTSGYLWMFVDGIAGNVEGAQATAEVDGEGEFGAPAVVLADVWMGSMGSIPLAPSGAKYDQFLLDYQAQSSTLGTCGGSDVDLTDSCACDQTKDNAGNLLFQHDHDLDDATPDKCAGFVYDPSDVDYSAPNAYSYLAFDAVWALAVAANSLIEDGATEFGGSQMQEALKSISFEGITGTVDFESNGDREVGVGFTIMNWASSDGYVTLGNWDKDSGLVYEDGAEASIVYATEDNSRPPDIVEENLIATLNIGFLHPVYRETLAYDGGGHLRLVGSLMAIEAINADPDILPDTVVKFEFLDSKRSSGVALQGAMDHATSSFGNDGAHAVVGPASSGPSMNAQLVLKNFGIPQISYVATHMLLPCSAC